MNRIDFISALTKGAYSLLDVGCDHAYTLINAIKKYGVKKGIGTDINEAPLENARLNIKKEGLEGSITLKLSDGLKNVDDICDCLVISGMGGILIKDILNHDLDKVRKFKKIILSPNQDSQTLRAFLINSKINIIDEFMIEDNKKVYEIIVCDNLEVKNKYGYFDMKFGPYLLKKREPLFISYYTKKLENLKKAYQNVKDDAKKDAMKLEINILRKVVMDE